MVNVKYDIFQINPDSLLKLDIISDENLKSYLDEVTIPSTFIPNEDFIELAYYTLDNTKLLSINNYTKYSVLSGDSRTSVKGNSEISIDPLEDYKLYYNDNSEVKALYHFLRNSFRVQDTNSTFSLESLSADRTELRLIPVSLGAIDVGVLANRLENRLENSTYNLDIHLYSSTNEFHPIVNIGSRDFRGTTAIVVKLAEPLKTSVEIYSTFSVIEKVSDSLAYEINSIIEEQKPSIPTLRGANFNVGVGEQSTEPSEYFNYNELFSFPNNNSNRELNSLFNEKGAELGIDYSEFSNFINFSSIEERLRNFKYKVELLESYQVNLNVINTTGVSYNSSGISGSRQYYENLLDGVVNNFDHYERSLYYESGSNSWPKSNTTKPYTNQQSNSTDSVTWYGSKIQEAVLYDAQNVNILTNTIPSYLKEDGSNDPYNLFINMIGQHFDNLWTYTDAVSKKYDADNRLNRGVSKDLVEELLKNFGLKLYTSNKSAEDLFKYFVVNSYDAPDEYLPGGIITSGEQPLSQNDYQKEINKRIYHNLPILLKSKGTERGLRALINCFGIPSDILKIKIYGGQSTTNLPFYGGEQAWTGSIDKVRLDNTGSLVEGSTLSYYTGITRGDSKYTQDLHRIEVGFSPSDNMDSYIVSQSAVLFPNDAFNIDDYIGDPRGYTSNIYPDLVKYSKIVFENADSYDLKDFVRLIKFFDNVVFRMVKDFVPARTVADTGIIIKPHLLERYHAKSPVMTWTRPEYSGSINTAFISGSNAGAYQNTGAGSAGTLFSRESSTKTQTITQTPLGRRLKLDKTHEEPKFNGELHRALIRVSNGELNRDNPFKNLKYPIVKYGIIIHKDPPSDVCLFNDTELDPFPLNPELPNTQSPIAAQFNLSSLFQNASAIIDYTVTQNGQTTNVLNQQVYYDFTANGAEQYEEITVFAYHSEVEDCSKTRTVVIVKCDLEYIGSIGLPPTLTAGFAYNFEAGVNTGENTELEYTLGGIVIDNPSSHQIGTTDYTDQSSITLSVKDINDPLGCVVTAQFTFSTCEIIATNQPFSFNGIPPYIQVPYTFGGTNDNGQLGTTTTYKFRLLWDNTHVTIGGQLPDFEANRFGPWVDIALPIPHSQLSEILGTQGYQEASPVVEATGPSPETYENTFSNIDSHITNNLQSYRWNFIRIQFEASNPGGCSVVSNNLYRIERTQQHQEPSVYYYDNQVHHTLNTSGNGGNSICCSVNNASIWVENSLTLADVFESTQLGFTPNNSIWEAHPTTVYQGIPAPQGYYHVGDKFAFWNYNVNQSNSAYWSVLQECDYSEGPNSNYIYCP